VPATAIDQEDWHRMRCLGVEDDRAVLLEHDLGATGVDHRQRLERPDKPDW